MARIEAAHGLEADCREHSAEALRLAKEHDVGAIEHQLLSVAGLLELTLGNLPEAVDFVISRSPWTVMDQQRSVHFVPIDFDMVCTPSQSRSDRR